MTSTKTPSATSPAHLMQLFSERAAAGDLDGLLDLYERDAVFQPEFGVVLSGHEQIRPALAEFLKLEPKISYTKEADVVIDGDIALVTNFWTMTGVTPDGTAVGEGGVSADVVRRQDDGSWRVLFDQPRGEPKAA